LNRTRKFTLQLGATVVVFQSPASFRPVDQNISHLREFFKSIDREGLILAWEPRDLWPEDLIREVCEELRLIHCVDPFKNIPLAGDFQYSGLHGISGYNYAYTDQDLNILKTWIRKKPTYLLLNNKRMYEDAIRF
jgi:uncharacterized protein YecE (DUF72 family)